MTRNATTKFIASALAVASLGLASSAQADQHGVAIGEPTPGKPVPTQVEGQAEKQAPAGPATPAQPPAPKPGEGEEVDYTSQAYFKSPEAKRRFERYCNMKDAEPSHSDKKFCEDYRRVNGTGASSSTGGSAGHEGNPEHRPYPHKPGYEHKPDYHKPSYEKASADKPEANEGSLPFTGLEMWQLGLIGIVLAGGGFGVRRLLVG